MKKHAQKNLLAHAVLASTLFSIPLAHATVFNGGMVAAQTTAGNGGVIQVGPLGQIQDAAADAVTINSAGGQLIIDAGNTFAGVNAVEATGAAFHGVNITNAGTNGSVTVGALSGIHASNAASGNGILVDAANIVINNAGTIDSQNLAAVSLTGTGQAGTFTLNNQLGGILQNNNAAISATVTIGNNVNAPAMSLTNSGNIISLEDSQEVFFIDNPFTVITNNSTGIIGQQAVAATAPAIQLTGNATAGNIVNQGFIVVTDATSTANAIVVNGQTTGNIVNSSTGTISSTIGGTLLLNNNMTTTNTPNVTNNGVMSATGLVAGDAVIKLGGFTLSGGITNNGIINNTLSSGASYAIDLSLGKATLTQAGGVVTGNVLLAGFDSAGNIGKQNPLIMTGGTFASNVVAANVVGNQNILTISGGTIAGALALGNQGDTLNLSGGNLNTIVGGAGGDTFNVSGGSFNILYGNGGADVLNVNATFTSNGTIQDVPNINVKNSGTLFTNNGNIVGLNTALTINPGTTLLHNGLIQGQGNVITLPAAAGLAGGKLLVTNNTALIDLSPGTGKILNGGTVELGPNAILNVNAPVIGGTTGVFSNVPNGILQTDIAGVTVVGGTITYGQMIINDSALGAANLTAGSFVKPVVTGFMPQGQTFDLITVNGGGSVADSPSGIIQPNSAVVFFTKNVVGLNNNILRLTSNRNSYTNFVGDGITSGVAGVLDVLASGNGPSNQGLLNLLIQLDNIPTGAQLEEAMESLVPPFNYSMVKGAQQTMELAFDGMESRFEDNRNRKRGKNGVSYGDPAGAGTVWGKVLGTHVKQKERNNIAGYTVEGAGLALGADWGVNECFTLGFAGSYAKVDTDDKDSNPKDQNVKSWQASVYSQMEFTKGLYLDAMAGVAFQDFHTNRAINVGNIHTAAQGDFDGKLWGLQAELGWDVGNENYFLAPFTKIRYSHLDLDDYVESGASSLGLSVTNNDVNTFMAGLGVRLGTIYRSGDTMYAPEISAMIGYDFKRDIEATTAVFVAGSPAFVTDGVGEARTLFNLGLGVNAHLSQCTILGIQYNLELRNQLVGNSGLVQFSYLWG